MPKKTCDNPLRRPHSKKKKSVQVQTISTYLWKIAKKFFPGFYWKRTTKLCLSCRFVISEKKKGLKRPNRPAQPENVSVPLTEAGEGTSLQSSSNQTSQRSILPSSEAEIGFSTQSSSNLTSQGSTFADVSTSSHDFNVLLQNLKIQPPFVKPTGKSVQVLFNQCIEKVTEQFNNYFGCFQHHQEYEKCSNCVSIYEAVQRKLPATTSKKEKYMMLTSLPQQLTIPKIHENFHVSTYMAKKVSQLRSLDGPFSAPNWRKTGKRLDQHVIEKVVKWYLSDDNSRTSPNARDTVMVTHLDGTRTREAKRLMLCNRREAYEEFKHQHPGLLKMTKFASLRPTNCRWPGHQGVHRTCVCIIHENFKLMLEGLKHASIEQIRERAEDNEEGIPFEEILSDYAKFIEFIMCSPPTENCFLGFCQNCPSEAKLQQILQFSLELDIRYKAWEKNDIVIKVDKSEEFAEHFKTSMHKFFTHEFLYKKQKEYIRTLKDGQLNGGKSGVLTVDFGENYSFIIQDAVQGHHWNNKQATICPFVLHFNDQTCGETKYKTYFVISDEMCHDATSVHAFKQRVIQRIKEEHPTIDHIFYVSDGAGSQFKNYKNIGNLYFHVEDFGIGATWIFTATSHGKSTCDGMSAIVKRTMRLKSLNEKALINDAKMMYDAAKTTLSSPTLEFFFVTENDVKACKDQMLGRYEKLNKIAGIRQNHHFAVNDGELEMKRHSFSEHTAIVTLLRDETGASETSSDLATSDECLEIGDFVAVKVGTTYQIGLVVEYAEREESITLRTMKRAGKGGLSLVWPECMQEYEVFKQEILSKVDPPAYSTNSRSYRLSTTDLAKVRDKL